jgi:hypothetical protein
MPLHNGLLPPDGGWDSPAQPRPYPVSHPADRVVGFRSAASRHLEGVQHAREHVEAHIDAGVPGPGLQQACVIKQRLVPAHLNIERAESGQVGAAG